MMDIPLYIRNPDGTELIFIPGGWFWMGASEKDGSPFLNEKPLHKHFVKPFYIGLTCITVKQFRRFVKETGYKGGMYPGRGENPDERWGRWEDDPDDHPVRYINWYDAVAYCKWAGLRLPGEAEWELAARGYEKYIYPWGDEWDESRVYLSHEKGKTVPVFYNPEGVSPFGLFQPSGNIWEWCADGYESNIYDRYRRGDFSPSDEEGARVIRGGSSSDREVYLRVSCRIRSSPRIRGNIGLRPVKDIDLPLTIGKEVEHYEKGSEQIPGRTNTLF